MQLSKVLGSNIVIDSNVNPYYEIKDVKQAEIYHLVNEKPEKLENWEEITEANKTDYLVKIQSNVVAPFYTTILTVQDDHSLLLNTEHILSYGKTEEVPEGDSRKNELLLKQGEFYNKAFSQLANYKENKLPVYENIEKLMPFINRDYIIEVGNQLNSTHPFVKKEIKATYLFKQGKMQASFDEDNYNQMDTIRILYIDDTWEDYEITFKNYQDNITSYVINDLGIIFTPKTYVTKNKANAFSQMKDLIQSFTYKESTYLYDYHMNPKAAYYETDNELNKSFFPLIQEEMATTYLYKLATNDPKYAMYIDNPVMESLFLTNLKGGDNNPNLLRLLTSFSYMRKWYDVTIGGFTLYDVLEFQPQMYTDTVMTETLKNNLSRGNRGEVAVTFHDTEHTPYATDQIYAKLFKTITGQEKIAGFLESLVNKYEAVDDMNDWFVSYFKGVIYEGKFLEHPEVPYRAWDLLKKMSFQGWFTTFKGNGELLLPILTADTTDMYIISTPTLITTGSMNLYSEYETSDKGPDIRETIKGKMKKTAEVLIDKYRYSYSLIDPNLNVISSTTMFQMDARMTRAEVENKNKQKFEGHYQDIPNWYLAVDPTFKWFYVPLGVAPKVLTGAAAAANTNGYVMALDVRYLDNMEYLYFVLSHEGIHNLDRQYFLQGKSWRNNAGVEDYTDGLLSQYKSYDITIGVNTSMQLGYTSQTTMNVFPEDTNTEEKFQSYYKNSFDAIYLLDYLAGQAFLKMTPEQQSKIAVQQYYTNIASDPGNEGKDGGYTNSAYRKLSADTLKSYNLKTMEDLWDHHIMLNFETRNYSTKSYDMVTLNNVFWYQPHNDYGRPDSVSFKRLGLEMGGEAGYKKGFAGYLSNTYLTDLAALRGIENDSNLTWKDYKMNRFSKIVSQAEDCSYLDMDWMQTMVEQELEASANNGNLNRYNTLRKKLFLILSRSTQNFKQSIFVPEITHITSAEMFKQKIEENPYGSYVLDNDLDFTGIESSNSYLLDCTFTGKIEGNGHSIQHASKSLFKETGNSLVQNIVLKDSEYADNNIDKHIATKNYTSYYINISKTNTVEDTNPIHLLQTKVELTKENQVSLMLETDTTYQEEIVIHLYKNQTGGTPIEVKDSKIEANTITIELDAPWQTETYYISATEGTKKESARTFFVVSPYITPEISINFNEPEEGEVPANLPETDSYMATISWLPEINEFYHANTEYTATITLTPKEGHLFSEKTKVNLNGEEQTVTYIIVTQSLVLTKTFPRTGAQSIVTNPIFSVEEGEYRQEQDLTLSCLTEGAEIYYTLDESTPSKENGVLYQGNAIHLKEGETIVKAIAYHGNYTPSSIIEKNYLIKFKTKAPVIKPGNSHSAYTKEFEVTITTDEPNTKIYYTLGGSLPNQNSYLYTGPIMADSGTNRIYAIAVKDGQYDSDVSKVTYLFLSDCKAFTPTANLAEGSYKGEQKVELTTRTQFSKITYTLDGSDPQEKGTVYTEPITLPYGETTLKAKVWKGRVIASDILTLNYTVKEDPYYEITMTNSTPEKGTINIEKTQYREGENVTFKVIPNEYNKLETIQVKEKESGNIISIIKHDDTYTFSMPAKEIIIEVSFTWDDTIKPTGQISIETKQWKEFSEIVKNKSFYQGQVTANIIGEDKESGIQEIAYYISDKAYTMEELKKLTLDKWQLIQQEGNIKIVTGKKQILYVKLIDVAGNVQYINSDWIIPYEETILVDKQANFDKNEQAELHKEITLGVRLNGNTIHEIKQKQKKLKENIDYYVTENTIVLSKEYLQTLPTETVEFTIAISPLGEVYIGEKENEPEALKVSIIVTDSTPIDHSIEIKNSENGKIIELNKQEAKEGETVSFSVTPNKGYITKKVTAYKSGNSEKTIPLNQDKNDYTFTMENEPVEIKAEFEPISYTISYYQQDGTAYTTKPYQGALIQYTIEDTITLQELNRDGYKFIGWYDEQIGGNKIESIEKGSIGDKKLYERWEKIDTPMEPEKPVEPEKPEKPEKPEEPVEPDNPDKPVEPNTPDTPIKSEISNTQKELISSNNKETIIEPKVIFLKDEKNKISITANKEVLDSKVELSVEKIENLRENEKIKKIIEGKILQYVSYDIKLLNGKEEVQPNGEVQVSITIPDNFNKEKIILYHFDTYGNLLEMPSFKIKDNQIIFSVSHFSKFVLAEQKEEANEVINNQSNITTEKQNLNFPFWVCGISILLGIIIIIFILKVRHKK